MAAVTQGARQDDYLRHILDEADFLVETSKALSKDELPDD